MLPPIAEQCSSTPTQPHIITGPSVFSHHARPATQTNTNDTPVQQPFSVGHQVWGLFKGVWFQCRVLKTRQPFSADDGGIVQEFRVHWVGWNKRYDVWLQLHQLDCNPPLPPPEPEPDVDSDDGIVLKKRASTPPPPRHRKLTGSQSEPPKKQSTKRRRLGGVSAKGSSRAARLSALCQPSSSSSSSRPRTPHHNTSARRPLTSPAKKRPRPGDKSPSRHKSPTRRRTRDFPWPSAGKGSPHRKKQNPFGRGSHKKQLEWGGIHNSTGIVSSVIAASPKKRQKMQDEFAKRKHIVQQHIDDGKTQTNDLFAEMVKFEQRDKQRKQLQDYRSAAPKKELLV